MTGNPLFSKKYLIRLILPLIAEQFLAIAIGACDTVMVSSVGEAGVSGVSLIDQFSQLMIQLFAAFATGGAVISSQYLGHKDKKSARKAAKQLFYLSVFAGLSVVLICLPLRKIILNFLYGGIEADVMNNALTYFAWVLLSFPFLAVYNSSAALYRSMGNSKLSLKVSILMNLINIGGNAILIYGAKLGVAGAGISTLASRVFAAAVMTFLLCHRGKNEIYYENLHHFIWDGTMVRRILKIGIPSGIENSVFHIGKISVQSFMSGFGTVAIAANAISNTMASFSNIPGNAIGLASVTVIGQCIGAGEKEQAVGYGKKLMRETYLAMLLTSSVIFAFSPFFVGFFNLSQAASNLTVGVVRTCMCANVIFWPMSFTMPNILRAAGDAKYTMIVSNISMWLFRVLFSYLISFFLLNKFPENHGIALYGVWFGMYIDWVFRAIMFLTRFCSKKWLTKKVI